MALPPARPDDVLNVCAGSFAGGALAPDSIASGFGPDLTAETIAGAEPATTLGGVSVAILDAAGTSHAARLLSVSPAQVNYLVPAETALGPATVSIRRAGGPPLSQKLRIARTAPGLFTFNGALAAAAVVRVHDGQTTIEDVFQLDGNGQIVPKPINVLPAADQVFLVFFGTGFRKSATTLMTANGFPAPVVFAGPQGGFAGLDQVNLYIPPSFAGAGIVAFVLKADGQPSNTVFLAFQ